MFLFSNILFSNILFSNILFSNLLFSGILSSKAFKEKEVKREEGNTPTSTSVSNVFYVDSKILDNKNENFLFRGGDCDNLPNYGFNYNGVVSAMKNAAKQAGFYKKKQNKKTNTKQLKYDFDSPTKSNKNK